MKNLHYSWRHFFLYFSIFFLGAQFASAADPSRTLRPEELLPPAPAWRGKSERLIVGPKDPWITPAEQSGFKSSPNYAETRAWIEKLDAATPLVRVEVFGKSPEGRDMLVVIASKDGATLDLSKPVVLAQAGIHSGEIDGKDAGFMLLRDIAFRGKASLLDRVNLLFVPIFSVDAHERSSIYNRVNQRGPENQGWRTTAQNINLNRDYAKLDSPEMRAMIALIRRFNPDLYIDIHVTDGIDYQYDITFGFVGWNGGYASSPAIAAWMDKTYRPALDGALDANGHIPGGLVFEVDSRDPTKGLLFSTFPPRYSHAYGDMIHMPSMLVENHSLKPFRQRVLGTYVLLEETLKTMAVRGDALRSAIASDRARRPPQLPVQWEDSNAITTQRDFLPMQYEFFQSPVSGTREVRWLGRPAKPAKITEYGVESKLVLVRPKAYWVPPTKPDVIERLRLHGIQMETLSTGRTMDVEMLRLLEARPAAQASEGHIQIASGKAAPERHSQNFPPGSVRVPTDQPLGDLAMILLEPESEDSFFSWGFFPEILQRTEYIEGYVVAPLAERMLAADPALQKEFEAKLAADAAFAADPDARLSWFYERTPYYDARYRLYPVGRELE